MAFTFDHLDNPDKRTWHVSGYQNNALDLSGNPNCMLLHFPGDEIRTIHGPETTHRFMADMTRVLPALEPLRDFRNSRGTRSASNFQPRVEEYGDYHVVLAQDDTNILDMLEAVPEQRRPPRTKQLEALVNWYQQKFENYCFVLACFVGEVRPIHPIVVEYVPHNDDVLFVPGLEAHDGLPPVIGQPVERDFRVAFGLQVCPQPVQVQYTDHAIRGQRWAPDDVTGMYDNRLQGPNQDYVVPYDSIKDGLFGKELLEVLVG